MEASHVLSSDSNILIVKYLPERGNLSNNTQLDLLLRLKNWDRVIKIKPMLSHFESDIKLLLYIKRMPKINLVFIGELRSWYMRQYFNILECAGCYALDDGNSTIVLQESIIKNRTYFKLKSIRFKLKMLINQVLSLLIFKKIYRLNSHINLFTCFNVEKIFSDQIILKNNFNYSKKVSSIRDSLENTAYFFGGPEDSEGIMSEDDIFDELSRVGDYFRSKDITLVYIPHRRETVNKLERLKRDLGFKFLYFKYPAEVEFILLERSPEYVSSFCSTALYTVATMLDYQSKAIAFMLPLEKMGSKDRFEYGAIYDEYKECMTVIDLERGIYG